jgi:hypothetical protein
MVQQNNNFTPNVNINIVQNHQNINFGGKVVKPEDSKGPKRRGSSLSGFGEFKEEKNTESSIEIDYDQLQKDILGQFLECEMENGRNPAPAYLNQSSNTNASLSSKRRSSPKVPVSIKKRPMVAVSCSSTRELDPSIVKSIQKMSKKSEASKKKEVELRRLRYGLGSAYGPGESGNGTIIGQPNSIEPGRGKISNEIGGARPGKGKFNLGASVKKNLYSGSSSKDREKFQTIRDSVMKTIH